MAIWVPVYRLRPACIRTGPGQYRHAGGRKTEDPDQKLVEASALVARLEQGDGVVVLTDMYGGTPSNIASRLIDPGKVEAVAGVSLPMLVRALSYSSQPLEIVVSKAITGGLEGVLYILPGDGNAAR
jgi:PTS system ascorbate-specific IIA component